MFGHNNYSFALIGIGKDWRLHSDFIAHFHVPQIRKSRKTWNLFKVDSSLTFLTQIKSTRTGPSTFVYFESFVKAHFLCWQGCVCPDFLNSHLLWDESVFRKASFFGTHFFIFLAGQPSRNPFASLFLLLDSVSKELVCYMMSRVPE